MMGQVRRQKQPGPGAVKVMELPQLRSNEGGGGERAGVCSRHRRREAAEDEDWSSYNKRRDGKGRGDRWNRLRGVCQSWRRSWQQ